MRTRVFMKWTCLGVMFLILSGCRLIMEIPDGPPETEVVCGDGTVQEGETCDGMDLGGQTCQSLGFGPGMLLCNTSCDGYLTSACGSLTCGNGELDTGEIGRASCRERV